MMSKMAQEQINIELFDEVTRLKHENQLLKKKCGLSKRRIDVIIGSLKKGRISYYFNDSNSWESQIPKEDEFGSRYIEKQNTRHYIYPNWDDFKLYIFSEEQARIIRESFKKHGKGRGGYRKSITDDAVCILYLKHMKEELLMKEIHGESMDEDEDRLLALLFRDYGEQGYVHENIDHGYSLDLIKTIQKVLAKSDIQ